jgi:hypothetical protein
MLCCPHRGVHPRGTAWITFISATSRSVYVCTHHRFPRYSDTAWNSGSDQMHWCADCDGDYVPNGTCVFVTAIGAFLCAAATVQGFWHLRRIQLLHRFEYSSSSAYQGASLELHASACDAPVSNIVVLANQWSTLQMRKLTRCMLGRSRVQFYE